MRVPTGLHVHLPFGSAERTRLARARVAGGRGTGVERASTDRESLDERAIEPKVELLRPSHAHQVVLILPTQLDLEQVLPIHRKIVPHCDAAARSEREVLGLPLILNHMQRDLEGLHPGSHGWQARSQARHLARHRHVSLHVRGRDRERVGEIVEAAIRGLVTRQERLHVHLEREQVVDRVVVFQAVQAMHRIRRARVGVATSGRPIELRLQPARHQLVFGRIGPQLVTRRHRARAQLPDYGLPSV